MTAPTPPQRGGGLARLRGWLRPAAVPFLALVTALLAGAVLIVLTDYEHLQHLGTDPAGAIGGAIGGVLEGYGAMLAGAIGDPARILTAIRTGDPADITTAIRPLSEALVSATAFIFVSLGVAVAFHAGLLNLGADGQFLIGGAGAGVAGFALAGVLPAPLTLIAALVGGTLAGAAYGFVPGALKARTGAHEVITTLMLNAMAPGILVLLSQSRFGPGPGSPIPSVPPLLDIPTIRVDWGFVAALVMAAVVSYLLFRTTLGFELRASGFSRTAARVGGIRSGASTIIAMSVSGGLIGMGSAFLTLGPGSPAQIGFFALALALIAGLRPSTIVLVSLLFGALNNGAKQMVIVTGIPLALLVVIIAFAMMFVAAPGLIRTIWRLKPAVQAADA